MFAQYVQLLRNSTDFGSAVLRDFITATALRKLSTRFGSFRNSCQLRRVGVCANAANATKKTEILNTSLIVGSSLKVGPGTSNGMFRVLFCQSNQRLFS